MSATVLCIFLGRKRYFLSGQSGSRCVRLPEIGSRKNFTILSMPRRSRDVGTTDRNDTPKVGIVLRRAREYWKLSLREVERRTGRSNAYLSQVERALIRQPDPTVLLE